MTIEEKRQAIADYCRSKQLCTVGQGYPCPLYHLPMSGHCYKGVDDADVEQRFELVSAMPDYCGQKEDMEVWSVEKDIEIENTLHELRELEAVNHPSHYNQGGIECIDAMVSAFGKQAVSSFCLCNAFKYIWRADHKNGREDIEKANWYLTKYKELTADEAV